MSDRATDTFEDRLRAGLVALRPPSGVPPTLLGRVAAIPHATHRRHWPGLLARRAAAFAMTGVAAIALVYAVTRGPMLGVPGGAPNPTQTPVTFDPALEGPGILRSADPVLPVVAAVAALVVLVVGLRWALRWRWHNLVLRAAPFVVLAAALGALAVLPDLGPGNAYGARLGYDVQFVPPAGAQGPSTWFSTAEPGGPTAILVTVRNSGPVPVRLEGLVETETADTPLVPRFTALWLAGAVDELGSDAPVRPFEPVTLNPDEQQQVIVVGRAGMCAFGPGYEMESGVTGFTSRAENLRFAYSVLWLTNQATVELPMALVEPNREHCT